ncbi:MAG TPA: glycoside hydrolase family 20 zincin-like fold domain-containing protein [Candidatus Baltobacteraceae bacterium]|jgi:hypothetical protein|nr:glycoside hydrolase family 20 zincin-like fold domain-containing protein [Candidatus Baltobacteraceae bacterium]
MIASAAAAAALHLLPGPQGISAEQCANPFHFTRALRVARGFDPGAQDEIDERWSAVHIPKLSQTSAATDVRVVHQTMQAQAYRLETSADGAVRITAGDSSGVFYAAMTLAQLPQRSASGWILPCVRIDDAPALRWRVLMDDVSRGPLPTMRYFEERIRTIAAFKMNGYSPMMEHVFVDPRNPLPAPLDGITPEQLHVLDVYARRFHVALIPAQQTFAHMHNTLAIERYAAAADLPHAFFMRPESPVTQEYLRDVIGAELQAVPHPPFFHIMSDEASASASQFASHVQAMKALVKPSGAKVAIWDDALQRDPAVAALLPRDTVVTTYHYDVEPSYARYIANVARGGFSQMVAPSAQNYNEVFPDVTIALANENGLISDGKAAHVLGLYESVWHDDGQSLFESTWFPVLYAAASAWEAQPVPAARFTADFPFAFFGSSDSRFGTDVLDLADAQSRVAKHEYAGSDYYLWSDAFDSRVASRLSAADLHAVRLEAENVEEHLLRNIPPLHAGTARAMFLAARTFDVLGRKYQAASEIAQYYAQAQSLLAAGKPAERDLYWCKYWFWELRDDFETLADLYARAWLYEDRSGHLASNLERYHLEAQRDILRADRMNAVTFEDYERQHTLPDLRSIVGSP